MHYARVQSSLGDILLAADSGGLAGLYFVGQKDCPVLPGLPEPTPQACDPRAGLHQGKAIHSLRIAEPAAEPRLQGVSENARVQLDSQFRCLDTPSESARQTFTDTVQQLQHYFNGQLKEFSVMLDLSRGTAFQRAIWAALLKIPYGDCWSYGQLAQHAGYGPGYGRATGAAVGANPITIIVPCHRVVAGNQRLNGYSGGLARKLALLQHEGLALAA
jgi:methylated-DNA-[protein]-cysteine S-methyltransferase